MYSNVSLYAASHDTSVESRRDGIEYSGPITIEDDCWIGGNTVVLPNVVIGYGSTIAAGSVVTKSVPSNCVAGGTPAKVLKQLK